MRGKIVSFPSYITNLRDSAVEIFARTLTRKSVFHWLNHVRIVSLSLWKSRMRVTLTKANIAVWKQKQVELTRFVSRKEMSICKQTFDPLWTY